MHDFSQHQAAAQPVYKNYNQRVDVITGQICDKNQKNAGYERFTEGSQAQNSSNINALPSDLTVRDPVTGRDIVKLR